MPGVEHKPRSVLRPGVLAGTAVALGGAGDRALGDALQALGARVEPLDGAPTDDAEPGAWAAEHGPLDALVLDAAGAFADGGADQLLEVLAAAWSAVREVSAHLIAQARPGRIVFVAPPDDGAEHAAAVRAGLENLARTLSIEWARYTITTCAVLPSPASTPPQVIELVAYLLSPAGGYFSGCRFALR